MVTARGSWAARSVTHANLHVMDRPSAEQVARYRAMTPVERLRQSYALYWTARRLRTAHERAKHPEWTEAEIDAEVRRIFLRAAT